MVNQSQVSCALGQQALEGRRVPRMSSGKTLPSFMPYDPNPRADGFITDRFLTGVRPQEYYFHCMAGREGLVDTAVKTSRSGYLQRCLVKHLEELKVSYDNTVRDGEGSVIQFLYGEDGIDPTKAPHLECSSSTFQYIARNHKSLERKYTGLPNSTIDIASSDYQRSKNVGENSTSSLSLLKAGDFVKARKLRVGTEWKRGALCRGWFDAVITKVHSGKKYFDITYLKDQRKVSQVPVQVNFDYAGGRKTRAASTTCAILVPSTPDPIIFDVSREQGKHRIGSSGACVSERVAGATIDALENDKKLQKAIKSSGISNDDFGRLIAKKYGSALCAPGEAVGCIAAQSIGEPSTQMTLNTFHLAGAGANVTLGIPRLREIIMTASKELKTPTMSVPLDPSVSDREATNLTRYFTKLTLMELIASKDGIAVTETLQQAGNGTWERAYHVRLKFHSKGRMADAFGLTLEDIAAAVAGKFIPKLSTTMKMEMRRASPDSSSQSVAGGEKTTFVKTQQQQRKAGSNDLTPDDEDANQGDEYDDEVADEEDGVKGRYGHREEMVSYGDMDDEEKEMEQTAGDDETGGDQSSGVATVTDDEGDYQSALAVDSVKIDHKTNSISMPPLRVIASKDGIAVTETLQQAGNGTWERAYHVRLKFHSKGRMADAFGLTLEDIAAAVAGKFIPKLSTTMKMEMRRASPDSSSQSVAGGEKTTFVKTQQQQRKAGSNDLTPDDEDANQGDEYDDEVADEEDGVKGRYGHREEMVSYGDMDDEEKEMEQTAGDDETGGDQSSGVATVTDDEGDYQSALAVDSVKIDHKTNSISMPPLRVDPAVQPLLMVGLVERAATSTIVRARPRINEAYINTEEDGRGRCLQTAGVNFEEMWILDNIDHNRLLSNDIWAIKCAYGVEAARMSIVDQIRGVFAVYGIEVDPRHLSLIADYMTFNGGYKAMNRIGMTDCSSPFLQMSFETTANFMVEAAVHGEKEPAMSPSANIVIGRPIRHGTGAFECLAK